MNTESRMNELVNMLNYARQAYYTGGIILMSDATYDRYLAELVTLEAQTSTHLPNSPSMHVGFEEVEGKIKHYAPILSLKDTKSIDEVLYFLGEEEGLLSWKLDGVSIVLYYEHGELQLALSRGDGYYGKDITKNVLLIPDIPKTIPAKNTVVVRGEGCIALKDFDNIKKTKEGEVFSNPRNLASGLINRTRTTSVLLRHMHFVAHTTIVLDGVARRLDTRYSQLQYLRVLGFNVVPHTKVLNFELIREVENYTSEISNFAYPVDGLVLTLNNIEHAESLGATLRYPRHSIAFKWPDEVKLTKVTGMKWSVSKTGLITPVVIFETIELEGTKVKQANLHSLKIFEELSIGVGDTLQIYKANKIIPEVMDNMTRSNTEKYPYWCPVCASETTVVNTDKSRKLYCYHCGGK